MKIFFTITIFLFFGLFANGQKISVFGQYEGFSYKRYDEWLRISQYVKMTDGADIAVDVIRPIVDGGPEKIPLPVIWSFTRYHRSFLRQGAVRTYVDAFADMQKLVTHGYVIVIADVRGSGASSGVDLGPFSEKETQDAFEITEWIAKQTWSNGNVGMSGQSYLGIAQLMAASKKPPHLKAIFPSLAAFDLYDLLYTGGIFRNAFIDNWAKFTRQLDLEKDLPKTDEDVDGILYKEARLQHKNNFRIAEEMTRMPYREDWKKSNTTMGNPADYLSQINQSGIPVYQWAGFQDIYPRDAFLWYINLKTPQKLTVGPWTHLTYDPAEKQKRYELLGTEELRWFDYWLKGIDNGIMKDPPVHYALTYSPGNYRWQSSSTWPAENTINTNWYFTEKGLTTKIPEKGFKELLVVDSTASSGFSSRWLNGATGVPVQYDFSKNISKGWTISTEMLQEDIVAVGHPYVSLPVHSNTGADFDVFIYLLEINEKGIAEYVSEGQLRASHRKKVTPSFISLPVPFHSYSKKDETPVKGGAITLLEFDLQPIANVFNKGNKIMLLISFCDKDNSTALELKADVEYFLTGTQQKLPFLMIPNLMKNKINE